MRHSSKHFFVTVLLLTGVALAQVAKGAPRLGSFAGGPFDIVNLGNLNVHFTIPVLHKAGRGVPFSYDLSYDSSIWAPMSSSGTTQWQPDSNWGWKGTTEAAVGYVSQTATQTTCTYPLGNGKWGHYPYTYWNTYGYGDRWGVFHPVQHIYTDNDSQQNCGTGQLTGSATATDGSGYTVSVVGGLAATVTSKSGATIKAPISRNGNSSGSFTDNNGNELTVSSNGTQLFDTLSSTVPSLTISSPAPPSSTTFTYVAPSGGNAVYSMNYQQYTVQTHFAVSGVTEYGPLSNSLVSSITLPDGTSYTLTYEQTPGSCTPLAGTYSAHCVTGRIASVTLPTGGTITYGYSGGNNGIESDGSTAGLTRTLNPGGGWQYSRTLVAGTPGPGSTWTTTITDPAGNQTALHLAEDSTKTTSTTTATYNFFETQRQVKQLISGTQTLLATVIKCYNAVYANCATATVGTPITRTDIYSQLPNNSTRLSEVVYNPFGLITDDKEYDYGVTMGVAPGNTKLIRETATAYATLGNGIVNKPSSVTVYDWTSGTATTLASTTYAYDQGTPTATSGTPQHTSITGSRGNLTTVTTSTSGTASLSKTVTYYDTGNPNGVTDVNGAQITYVYSSAANPYNSSLTASCGNSFPTTINEPLSLSRSAQWNCIGGVMPHVTDENGQVVKSDYTDSDFWRPADAFDQAGSETTISYIGQTAVETSQLFNSSRSVADSRTTIDGFGRPILRQKLQGPGATNYDTVETDYNSVGQPDRSTMPFSAAGGATNSTAPSTNATYDALGRALSVTDANNGTVTNIYTNNDVLQQVSGGQTFQKQFEYDGLGRLTSVCEMSGTLPGVGTCSQATLRTGYWTKYTYDALGHLLKVTQNAQAASANQQIRTYVYDRMGRVTSETNPESGTTTYIYDSYSAGVCGGYTSEPGHLMLTTFANGAQICYVYDSLGRVSSDMGVTAGGAGYCGRFIYDSANGWFTAPGTINNPVGRLVEAETDSCAFPPTTSTRSTDEWFSYDADGRLTDVYELTPHSGSGAYYHSKASYFSNSSLNLLNLYSSTGTALIPTQTYSLDGEGRTNLVSAASGQNPVTSVTYSPGTSTAPLGALTNVTFGSADSDAFTYDPNTGRMKSYTFSVNGHTDLGTLNWNSNGTLQQLIINDQIPGTADSQTCAYGYDDVQRISNVTCGTFWVQNFTYDAFGNISKNVPSGDGGLSFLPSYWTSPPTNRFLTLPGATPQYDPAGNLLTDNLNTYTWDGYGKMATVSTGSTTVTSTYDALGRMVENNSGGSYTEFVYGPTGKLAKCNGQTLVKAFVALPGGAKAIYNSSGLAYYRHSDWLGSSRLTSTASRAMYSSSAYAPFGEQYGTGGSADASFTGQDPDTVSNLYDFLARRQSSSQGRWISPDPLGRGAATLTNPQSWNRYAYVLNNPLALVDPKGLDDSDGCSTEYDDATVTCGSGGLDVQDPQPPDIQGLDDGGGSGGGTGGDRNTLCVGVGAGIDTNMDNSFLTSYSAQTGAAVVFPYDSSTFSSFDDVFGGIANGASSVTAQSFGITTTATSTMANFVNNLTSANSNVVLVLFSGSAQAFSTAVNKGLISQQSLSNVSQIIYVSPGAPGGIATTGISTALYTGSMLDPVEGAVVGETLMGTATNNPGFFSGVTGGGQISGCGHGLECDINSGSITELPASSNCNSTTTTGQNDEPEFPSSNETMSNDGILAEGWMVPFGEVFSSNNHAE